MAHPLAARHLSALTTGWITAAGGAWNTSIVAEYLQDYNPPIQARASAR